MRRSGIVKRRECGMPSTGNYASGLAATGYSQVTPPGSGTQDAAMLSIGDPSGVMSAQFGGSKAFLNRGQAISSDRTVWCDEFPKREKAGLARSADVHR